MPARIAFAAVLTLFGSLRAEAVFIGNAQGGADFPQGEISFADLLVSYAPVIQNGEPTAANRGDINVIGLPDYAGGGSCSSALDCSFASLGDGGSVTVRFTDNVLTGSDSDDHDLWIFEVGPDVEDTFVEVSVDGMTWLPVGKVFGSTASIDLDAFGFGTGAEFPFVRLTDDGAEGVQTGVSVGADIDAIGAIATRPVPEPGMLASSALGVIGVAARRRRSR